MPYYGDSFTAYYWAWDTDGNTYKTGDVGQHTVNWCKDGTSTVCDNSPAEVANGLYKVVISATEAQCKSGIVEGSSSTSDIEIIGVPWAPLRLPNEAPGAAAGGLLTADDWTDARAALLDNLNIGENVAGTSEVTSIQNNTRCVRVVQSVMERPDSESTPYMIHLYLYATDGKMEAPDEAPAIHAYGPADVDRDSNLDSTTMTLVELGHYKSTYTLASDAAMEQLRFEFSVVEGGETLKFGNTAQVVDTTAVDFTAADRAKLSGVSTAATEERLARLDAAVSTRNATTPDAAGTAAGLHTTTDGKVDVVANAATEARLARLDATVSSRNATAPLDTTGTAQAVWNAVQASYKAAGSTGESLNESGGGSGGGATAEELWAHANRTLTRAVNADSIATAGTSVTFDVSNSHDQEAGKLLVDQHSIQNVIMTFYLDSVERTVTGYTVSVAGTSQAGNQLFLKTDADMDKTIAASQIGVTLDAADLAVDGDYQEYEVKVTDGADVNERYKGTLEINKSNIA